MGSDPSSFAAAFAAPNGTAERTLVGLGIAAFLIGSVPGLPAVYDGLLTAVCVAVAIAFAILYALRLRAAPEWTRYALTAPATVDLLAALPVPLALVLGMPAADARLLGVLWALKLIRFNPAFALLSRVLRNERQPLLSVTTVFIVAVLFVATVAYVAERGGQPDSFGSVPAAIWWAVATITTTGYGDKVPASFAGRLLAGGVMVSGIALFALWAGILASGFAAELRRREFLESWDLVVRVPLFRGLGAASLSEIAKLLKVQNSPAGAAIVRKGQPGDSMFFVADGAVDVHAASGRIALGPGQFFGEAALITGEPRNATVTATAPTRLLRLDVVEFRDLAARQPELLQIIEVEAAKRRTAPS